MKNGYTIINEKAVKNDKCIIVSNFPTENIVLNMPSLSLKSKQSYYDIGIWKLKSLKN